MTKHLPTIKKIYAILIIAIIALSTSNLHAQAPKARAITMVEYAAAKKLTFKDLDKETYLKSESGLVADRYEMKPPYTFNFSDGVERKIYLFKLMDSKENKELALLGVYKNVKTGKTMNLCVPTLSSDKQIWGQYIDDLKEYDKVEAGFASCMSFALGKELSTLLSMAGGVAPASAAADGEYEFCFTEESLVTMTDGSQKLISEIAKNDKIMAYDVNKDRMVTSKVDKLKIHDGRQFEITGIVAEPVEQAIASIFNISLPLIELEGTNNHPVYTKDGVKNIGDIRAGDIILTYEHETRSFKKSKVLQIKTNVKSVSKVYNIEASKKNFLINNAVVMTK
ncbi:MAG TPA: Hint domain-containing protein [Cytophagaceae bacterium]|jgi:hypothetical protein